MRKINLSILVVTLIVSPFIFMGSRVSAATFTVTNTNDSGAGSLRQAITDANGSVGLDDITFNIPGAGPFVIDLNSNPNVLITDALSFNGLTQPGSSAANPLINIRNASLTNFNTPVSSMSYSGLILENSTLGIFGVSSGTITNNRFIGGNGVQFNNTTNYTVTNNTFNNSTWGVTFFSGVNNSNTITNNTFTGGANGVRLNNGSQNTVSNNVFSGTSFSVNIDIGTNNTISNNSFNSVSYGVGINRGSNNNVLNNTFDSNSWPISNYNSDNSSNFNIYSQNNIINAGWEINNFNAANQNINPPVIESVQTVGSNLVITGYAKPGSRIEIFRTVNVAANRTSTFITALTEGSASDTNATNGPNDTNGASTARFTFTIPVPATYAAGNMIRVTATDPLNNTSQFSNAIAYTNTTVPNQPQITLNSSRNPSLIGESINLTATLSDVQLTGNVEFFNGNTSLGTVPISAGTATLSTSSLPLGSNNISVVYTLANLSTIQATLVQVVNSINVPNAPVANPTGGITIYPNSSTATNNTESVPVATATTKPAEIVANTVLSAADPAIVKPETITTQTKIDDTAATALIRTGGELYQNQKIAVYASGAILLGYLVFKSNQNQKESKN